MMVLAVPAGVCPVRSASSSLAGWQPMAASAAGAEPDPAARGGGGCLADPRPKTSCPALAQGHGGTPAPWGCVVGPSRPHPCWPGEADALRGRSLSLCLSC